MSQIYFLFPVFIAIQVVATLLFKYGSTSPSRWIPSFVIANIIGIASTWMLMLIYKHMNVNIAMGVAVGASFVASQLALMLVFHTNMSPWQIVGILGISGSMYLLCTAGSR